MIKIAPSILSADFAALGEAVQSLEKNGADYIHVDIMDGHFVPNITFGPGMVQAIKKRTNLPLDVHLMVQPPEYYIDSFADAGADILTVHAEATPHLQRVLSAIRKLGKKAGVSLNPATPLQVLDYVLDDLDMILIMTVNPGFGGQRFIPAMLDKIRSVKSLVEQQNRCIDIEVDGGIGTQNVDDIIAAGANVIVAGSSVFSAEDQAAVIRRLRGQEFEGSNSY